MDEIDRKLCEHLQADARLPVAVLARELALPVSSVRDRVRRLVETGVIEAFCARLADHAFDRAQVVFVLVDLSRESEDAALAALERIDGLQELHHVAGPRSWLLKLRVRDVAHFAGVLEAEIKAAPGVERTETLVVMESRVEHQHLPLTP